MCMCMCIFVCDTLPNFAIKTIPFRNDKSINNKNIDIFSLIDQSFYIKSDQCQLPSKCTCLYLGMGGNIVNTYHHVCFFVVFFQSLMYVKPYFCFHLQHSRFFKYKRNLILLLYSIDTIIFCLLFSLFLMLLGNYLYIYFFLVHANLQCVLLCVCMCMHVYECESEKDGSRTTLIKKKHFIKTQY